MEFTVRGSILKSESGWHWTEGTKDERGKQGKDITVHVGTALVAALQPLDKI
jgi:hypothetical protein